MSNSAEPNVISGSIELQIAGMTCASCVGRVEKALLKVTGVTSATVNLATEKATVRGLTNLLASSLVAAVEKAGYEVKESSESASLPQAGAQRPGWWSAALSGMTMPEAVRVSFSTRLTITRSCRGRSFMGTPIRFETGLTKKSPE